MTRRDLHLVSKVSATLWFDISVVRLPRSRAAIPVSVVGFINLFCNVLPKFVNHPVLC